MREISDMWPAGLRFTAYDAELILEPFRSVRLSGRRRSAQLMRPFPNNRGSSGRRTGRREPAWCRQNWDTSRCPPGGSPRPAARGDLIDTAVLTPHGGELRLACLLSGRAIGITCVGRDTSS